MSAVDRIGDALSWLVFIVGFLAVGAGLTVGALVAWRNFHDNR